MSSDGLVIRRARDSEGPVCRMLLPEIARERSVPDVLVAVQTALPPLAGAIAYQRAPEALFAVRLRVVRTARRRGTGSALLHAVLEEAARSGATSVHGRWDETPGADAEAFLAHHGFAYHTMLTTVEGDVEALREPVVALRDRMVARGRIPTGAAIVTFAEAPGDQVARLYAEDVIHNPALSAILAAHADHATRIARSPVLMVGNEVVGIMLFTVEDDMAHVQGRAVAPAYRGGWANGFLMAAAIEAAVAAGARRVRFEVPGENRDTIKLARRAHAGTVSTIHQWRLDLAAGGRE